MEIFKIGKSKYSGELKASGNEGRWNYKGQEVIYAASSRALASLEVLVHLSGVRLQNDAFKITVIHVPDNVSVENITYQDLPDGWNGVSKYSITQPLGNEWIRSKKTCILRVPSSIMINEFNFVININHPDFQSLRIVEIEDYLCDQRLLKKFQGN